MYFLYMPRHLNSCVIRGINISPYICMYLLVTVKIKINKRSPINDKVNAK